MPNQKVKAICSNFPSSSNSLEILELGCGTRKKHDISARNLQTHDRHRFLLDMMSRSKSKIKPRPISADESRWNLEISHMNQVCDLLLLFFVVSEEI
jgi:hypothetical protein